MKSLLLLALLLPLNACYSIEHPPFEASAISVTDSTPPLCKKGTVRISETWCQGDKLGLGTKDSFGFYDEVLYKSQTKHGVKYLLNTQIVVIEKPKQTCAHLKALLPKCESK